MVIKEKEKVSLRRSWESQRVKCITREKEEKTYSRHWWSVSEVITELWNVNTPEGGFTRKEGGPACYHVLLRRNTLTDQNLHGDKTDTSTEIFLYWGRVHPMGERARLMVQAPANKNPLIRRNGNQSYWKIRNGIGKKSAHDDWRHGKLGESICQSEKKKGVTKTRAMTILTTY